ncbi:MAG: hypothetical protein JXB48_17270 [Candidatus Latescibacteria bacterium]|nr:hypothetical protein [Candidatus Latescibacterota bacterium]
MMNKLFFMNSIRLILASLLVIGLSLSHHVVQADPVTMEQARDWSEKFRGWHYWPDYVISPSPGIDGFEKVHMTDVPTVFRIPEHNGWFMTFIGYDGVG